MTIGSIAGIIRHHARVRPHESALTTEHAELSSAQLEARSSQVAQALLADGVRPQDRIAFLDKGGPEFFEVLFGGAKVNAVNVGVNWRLAAPEIVGILNDAEATVLIVGRDFLPVVEAIASQLTTVRQIVFIGGADSYTSYDAWMSPHSTVDPGIASSEDDVALQLYTSGTTGLPKGVMLPNRSVFTAVPTATAELGYSSSSTNLVAMPLFHVGGVGVALMGLYIGCRTILMREVHLRRFLELVVAERVTHLFAVPAVLQFLLDEPDIGGMDFSGLETIVYGASPISVDVLERSMSTFGCRFIQTYGLTETHGTITRLRSEDHDPGGPGAHRLRSAGTPMPGVEIRTVDPDTGLDTATGEVGEVWARTSQNMSGYWNKPDESANAVTPDGWLKTGDAGYLDEDGFLYIHDRIKDMIISGGENVYPAEVENVLMSHPGVRDVAVIGVPSERWGETVKAIVVAADPPPEPDELVRFTRDRLAHYKCPTSVEFIDSLPRNVSGKIQKRELRSQYE